MGRCFFPLGRHIRHGLMGFCASEHPLLPWNQQPANVEVAGTGACVGPSPLKVPLCPQEMPCSNLLKVLQPMYDNLIYSSCSHDSPPGVLLQNLAASKHHSHSSKCTKRCTSWHEPKDSRLLGEAIQRQVEAHEVRRAWI